MMDLIMDQILFQHLTFHEGSSVSKDHKRHDADWKIYLFIKTISKE